MEEYVKSSRSTWAIMERIGGCLIKNAPSMTRESREAVTEHGIDKGFDALSDVHLMSLSAASGLCESESEAASASPSAETLTVTILSTPSPMTDFESADFRGL